MPTCPAAAAGPPGGQQRSGRWPGRRAHSRRLPAQGPPAGARRAGAAARPSGPATGPEWGERRGLLHPCNAGGGGEREKPALAGLLRSGAPMTPPRLPCTTYPEAHAAPGAPCWCPRADGEDRAVSCLLPQRHWGLRGGRNGDAWPGGIPPPRPPPCLPASSHRLTFVGRQYQRVRVSSPPSAGPPGSRQPPRRRKTFMGAACSAPHSAPRQHRLLRLPARRWEAGEGRGVQPAAPLPPGRGFFSLSGALAFLFLLLLFRLAGSRPARPAPPRRTSPKLAELDPSPPPPRLKVGRLPQAPAARAHPGRHARGPAARAHTPRLIPQPHRLLSKGEPDEDAAGNASPARRTRTPGRKGLRGAVRRGRSSTAHAQRATWRPAGRLARRGGAPPRGRLRRQDDKQVGRTPHRRG